MSVHDMQRYGRTRDLMPLLLSSVDTRIGNLTAEQVMMRQRRELLAAFGRIRTSFYHFARSLMVSQEQSERLLRDTLQELNQDFPRMGLEEDQESCVLDRIDASDTLLVLPPSLKSIYHQQRQMVDTFTASHNRAQVENAAHLGDIELF